jgi:hypothetical protein
MPNQPQTQARALARRYLTLDTEKVKRLSHVTSTHATDHLQGQSSALLPAFLTCTDLAEITGSGQSAATMEHLVHSKRVIIRSACHSRVGTTAATLMAAHERDRVDDQTAQGTAAPALCLV